MAKPNFAFEKRQKEIAKKQKKLDKQRQKVASQDERSPDEPALPPAQQTKGA